MVDLIILYFVESKFGVLDIVCFILRVISVVYVEYYVYIVRNVCDKWDLVEVGETLC